MKDAIRKGIEECGIVEGFTGIIEKLPNLTGVTEMVARIEALEAKYDDLFTVTRGMGDQLRDHHARLERHRLRIRWLERWAHRHWPGWLPRPGL